jgi:uncharacterized protein YkwD
MNVRFVRLIQPRLAIAPLARAWVMLGPVGCIAWVPRPRASRAPSIADDRRDPALDLARLVAAHNRARARAGLTSLAVSESLTEAAQRHADDMAAHRRMAHRGSDGSSPFRRMERQGYRHERAGENVAYGQRTPEEVMNAWLNSPGHRRNILGKYSEIGAAYATDEGGIPYWCVTFGTPLMR